ncbi:hypothetical protein [Sinorhizobium sp. BG8]|uniref:hypothetical protein n=1 Tax=Sinorhizobium sp. BG8 TaxID=2613773 RepID=UPI00193E9E73|nr:hypothetical protein [Sinorhizobium sp. BG8]QRM54452.1 hypothetical protein F3Y30_07765 [Sinorhizobium sp. BG8]
MRRFFIVLAFLGAMLAGWMPAASMAAHSGHGTTTAITHHDASAAHADGDRASPDHRTGGHPRLHPLLCAACFAVTPDAGVSAPAPRALARVEGEATTLSGIDLPPLDPPPRT